MSGAKNAILKVSQEKAKARKTPKASPNKKKLDLSIIPEVVPVSENHSQAPIR
jgi:hypothetical protein